MIEHVAEIVAAYVGKNRVDPAELPALILKVSQSLAGLGKAEAGAPASLSPAVSIRRSVGAAAITCLDCGKKSAMLKRHLTTAHGRHCHGNEPRAESPSGRQKLHVAGLQFATAPMPRFERPAASIGRRGGAEG
jgi:hypothetical protein